MQRSAILPSHTQAMAFAEEAKAALRHGSMPLSGFEQMSFRHGGTPYHSSSSGKELYLYQYQRRILDRDREYLDERDAIVNAINNIPARDTWMKPPISGDERINSFFLRLRRLGFFKAAWQADYTQRKWGYSFLYINAGGRSDAMQSATESPLTEGGSMWHGFQVIAPQDIDWEETVFDYTDPSLPHGILLLAIKADGDRPGFRIHGTRLVPFAEDNTATNIVDSRAKIDTIYDSIWNRRDVEFAQKQVQTEGNPYLITVDTESLPMGKTLSDEDAQDIQDSASEVRSGARDAFGPNENVKVERLGSASLDSPEWAMRMVIGNIAANCEFTSNMLMVFSRGSEQVTDQDRNDYADQIHIRREMFAWNILDRIVGLARDSGFMGAKRAIELPSELDWPFIRLLNQREEAFVMARHAATAAALDPLGRGLPPKLERMFPRVREPDATARPADGLARALEKDWKLEQGIRDDDDE